MKNGKVDVNTVGDVTEITIYSKKFGAHTCLVDTEDLPKLRGWCFCIKTQHSNSTFM